MTYQDGQRMPSSAIRYTTRTGTQPRTTTPPPEQSRRGTQRMTYDIYADVEYNPVPARRGQSVLESASLPRPRPHTNQDTEIRTRVNPLKPQLQPAQQPQRFGRRGLIFGGFGLVVGTLIAGDWALNTWNNVSLVMAQGPEPVRNLDLYCGHSEKPGGSPTWLHAFIHDYKLTVIEYPGGDRSKPNEIALSGLPPTGDISQWDLQMVKQQVDGGKWQIQLSVQGPGFFYHGLLVDSGQGYFRAVNTK